jgi:predicted GH43/DUF377 family glycosyl hydrolase
MNWRKLGLVHVPTGDLWWARGYAHLPTAYRRPSGELRIYFAGLDENRFGRIGYVDVDTDDPTRVIAVGKEPVLDLGQIGTFEDSGVVPCSIVADSGRVLLYYHGFQRTERVPYLIFAGLADATPAGDEFRRMSGTPILDRTNEEPFIRGAPYVTIEDGVYRMWYVSCTHWSRTGEKLHYNNEIRHATSANGIDWIPDAHVCLGPESPDEYSVGRPCVVRLQDGYHMWYSSRAHSEPYRIHHAQSSDGRHWERSVNSSIGRSNQGWDSEMICYANVIDVKGRRLMFYNGNGHGRSGFGVAVMED